MPATSKAQQRFFAMCEHGVSTNKACPSGMTKSQMHDFAATPSKGLPSRKGVRPSKGSRKKSGGHNTRSND